eukprot:280328-Pyramimonas_sp.AAC.1
MLIDFRHPLRLSCKQSSTLSEARGVSSMLRCSPTGTGGSVVNGSRGRVYSNPTVPCLPQAIKK